VRKPLEGRVIIPTGDPSGAVNAMARILEILNAHGEDLTLERDVKVIDMVPHMEGMPADLWWARVVS
jgi:hypothetical protein